MAKPLNSLPEGRFVYLPRQGLPPPHLMPPTDFFSVHSFNWDKLNNLVAVVVLSAAIISYVVRTRQGKDLHIRRIAGLHAIEEAIGRATEMGKPVLYLTGLKDVDQPPTLAALAILSHVARQAAEYETPILVPCRQSLAMTMAQEVVREAHVTAGRPDTYKPENIRYLTEEQFGFVAGVDGVMLRERPAANFFMGYYYAESLMLAETGHSTGAIQIAATDATTQLPFFVAACDYTLMGEELYAASAYLSRDVHQIGSLKGQDFGKLLIIVSLVVASLFYTVGFEAIRGFFKT